MNMKLGYNKVFAVAASALMLASCDFLDVAPAQRATLNDAMKNKASTEGWVYGVFSEAASQNPVIHQQYEGSAGEYVEPVIWDYDCTKAALGTINASNMPDWKFRSIYGSIGNVHLVRRELVRQNPDFLTEDDKKLYVAQTKFIEAYYYFRLLSLFGPIPIIEEFVDSSTTKDQFPGRSHYDFCVAYICRLLDEAYPDLPGPYALDNTYGGGNKTAAKALKSRALLYAASPLWNGEFPWVSWKNTNYETPGYGMELVSRTFDLQKWYTAKEAALAALTEADANGRELMQVEYARMLANNQSVPILPQDGGNYLPGIDTTTPEGQEFAEKVMLMRYVMASDETMGNKEFIWTVHSTNNIGLAEAKPRNIIANNSGSWVGGWAGLSPTLNIVQQFYTRNGKRPAEDPDFPAESQWYKSAGLDREEIINLNANREPRFYAWISFDGGDIGPRLYNGKPKRLNLRASANEEGSGWNTWTARDLNQTGYLADKFFSPAVQWTSSQQGFSTHIYPVALIRKAELYLNLAECCAEIYMSTGDETELQMALDNLNIIRKRAGVPELKKEDCAEKSIREWVRNERTIELFMEGHRYHDLRRWCTAEKELEQASARVLTLS